MSSKKRIYDFGPFRLDPVKHLLLREGEPVALTPKAFDTLLALVEVSGQVIEKGELMQRIWPDGFVEEGNLTVNISTLRKALGESPDQHRYIVTVPGRGYRFVADVHELWDADTELVVEERTRERVIIERKEKSSRVQPQTAPKLIRLLRFVPGTRRGLLLVFSPLLILPLAIGVAWKLLAPPSGRHIPNPLPALIFTPIANWRTEPGQEQNVNVGSFSRDGKMVAYFSMKDGQKSIWIKQLNGGDPIRITRDEWNYWSPVWSPDHQQLAFISDRGHQRSIWRMPYLGGTPTLLQNIEPGSLDLRYWSKDGKTIYYEANSNLFALDIASDQATRLTNFDSFRSTYHNFSISPDETQIAYLDFKDEQFDLWVAPMTGGPALQVTNDPEEDMYPTWHPDGRRVIYSSMRGGAYQICAAFLDGRAPQQITVGDNHSLVADVSPDGAKILYASETEESDIWQVKLGSVEDVRFTSDVELEFWPDVSADSRNLVFQSTSSWTRLAHSSILVNSLLNPEQKLRLTADGADPRWSPDGSKIAFVRFANYQFNLYLTKPTGGEETPLTYGGITPRGFSTLPYNRDRMGGYSWSPDSRKIAYCSKKSGQSNIWIISSDGTNENRLSDNTDANLVFYYPLWSPDSKRLAYVSAPRLLANPGENLRAVWINDGSQSEKIFQADHDLQLLGWTPSGDELIVAADTGKVEVPSPIEIDILSLHVTTTERRAIAHLNLTYMDNMELSPDGRMIAFVSRKDGKDNLWIIPASGGNAIKITASIDPRIYFSSLAWSPDAKAIYYGKQSKFISIKTVEDFN